MSDDVLKAIAALGGDLRGEIIKSRGEIAKLIEGVQTSVDAIRGDLTVLGAANDHTRHHGDNTRDEVRDLANLIAAMHRVLQNHGTRLDDLEKRPKP